MSIIKKVFDIVDKVVTLGGLIDNKYIAYGLTGVDPVSVYLHTHYVNPEIASSPTYNSNTVVDTISEGIYISRMYGKCKIGGNALRYNDPDDDDLRVILGHCQGPISAFVSYEVNDIAWGDLTGSHTKTGYTGTRTQTSDARFSTDASAYRGIAYTALTFVKDDQQIGYNPNITVIVDGLLCTSLAGGAAAFTRNPAVILYDWLINVEGYTAGEIDLNSFKSLEALCNKVPTGGTLPRYRFDYNFDTPAAISDGKKLIWQSFNGCTIKSQGKIKAVWDSGQMADGSGGLTAKTSSFTFTEDNIVKGTFKRSQPQKYNLVRVSYKDSAKNYDTSSVYVRDDQSVEETGEIPYEQTCYYITDAELARRRAQFLFNQFKYSDYECTFTAFSSGSKVELYDLITISHSKAGWSNKPFIVIGYSENEEGQPTIRAAAYYAGMYDDSEVSAQPNYASNLPNPYLPPKANTAVTASLVSPGRGFDFDSVKVSITKPVNEAFYSYTEVYVSNVAGGAGTYYLAGTTSGEDIVVQGMGMFYVPGDTVYVKTVNYNQKGIPNSMPASPESSVVITGSIRLGSFYAGLYDFWGGNVAIGHAATTIVLGNLDGVPKLAMGPSADTIAINNISTYPGTYIDGAGKFRAGKDGKYFLYDGTDISWYTGNTSLDTDGNLTIHKGGDITLIGDGINPGVINFKGETYTNTFKSDIFGAVFVLSPSDDNLQNMYIGMSDYQYFTINLYGQALNLYGWYDSDNYALIQSASTNTISYIALTTTIGADISTIRLYKTSTIEAFYPYVSAVDLGTATYPWNNLYANTANILGDLTINSDRGNVTSKLIFGRTTGGNGEITWNGTSFTINKTIESEGAVIAHEDYGFRNSVYKFDAANPIWAFNNATTYGLSYYQDNGAHPIGITGDAIGFHFGTILSPTFYVEATGIGYFANKLSIGNTAFIGTEKLRVKGDIYGDGLASLDALKLREKSADPAGPADGQSVIWQADGTGAGDDGDLMVKITAGGATKITTLIDFSAI